MLVLDIIPTFDLDFIPLDTIPFSPPINPERERERNSKLHLHDSLRETGIRSNGMRSNRQIGIRSNGIRSKGNQLENKI